MSWRQIKSVDYLVVHCSASPEEMDVDVSDIRRYHRQKGWFDVGYHYVINRDGSWSKGREDNVPGAHARGFNHKSLGICMVGGVKNTSGKVFKDFSKWVKWYSKNYRNAPAENNFTPQQFETLKFLLFRLKAEYPDAKVLGHRDLPNVNKACPSFDMPELWDHWNY